VENEKPCPDADFAGAGPFAAAVRTDDLEDAPVEVWYPAPLETAAGKAPVRYDMRQWLPAADRAKIPDDGVPWHETTAVRGLPAADAGPFPVVIFSHGLGGFRTQSAFLMTHLASWGFVIAAPEHPERGLAEVLGNGLPSGDDAPEALRATLDLLATANADPNHVLYGRVDLQRVAVTGHSAGGAAVSLVARDADVDAWVGLASAGFGVGPDKPFLLMGGAADQIATPDVVDRTFEIQGASPRRYVVIDKAGHLAFSDICAIGRDRGGLLAVAMAYGVEVPELLVRLGRDGCQDEALAPELGWPVINHYVTSHLRAALGMDPEARGLDAAAMACFGDRIARFATE